MEDADPKPTGLPPMVTRIPTYSETMAAGWRADRIERDVLDQREQSRMKLIDELSAAAGLPELTLAERLNPVMPERRQAAALRALSERSARDPAGVGQWPLDDAQVEAELQRRMRRDHSDAAALLANAPAGRFGAETLGRLASGIVDPLTLATAPVGAPAGIGIRSAMLVEGGVNMLGEAADLPNQFEGADYLGIDPPDALLNIAGAGVLGAGLGGAIAGGARFVEYRRTKGGASAATRPPGRSEAQHAADLANAQRALEADRAAAAPGRAAAMPGIDIEAAAALDRLEADLGRPLNINSGYRDPARNARVGGARGSQHTHGRAFDVDVRDLSTEERRDLIVRARAAGFRGVGVYDNSLHFDVGGERAWGPSYRRDSVPDWALDVVGLPSRAHPAAAGDGFVDWSTTSRGYTGPGQVTTAAGRKIDVTYEIVDIASLTRASGALQPRDRSRANSDAWIAETAAKLDPALLMPGPYADRGAPIVGPDGVIESGNGRVAAIDRAYALGLDRGDAYRAAISQVAEIPEGVARPVLIARRTTELDEPNRIEFVNEAQDSGVAELTPTEAARAVARKLTTARLQSANPDAALAHPSNAAFARAVLADLPQSQRNKLFAEGPDGVAGLNADGARLIENAVFERAWDAPDITRRAIEAETDEDLRSLMTALREAAPAWAALRADVDAGLVRPEFDITAEVLDAMRTIATARETARTYGKAVGAVLEELMADVDLLSGAISPLTGALIRKFAPNGKAAPAGKVAGFLKGYADQARKLGKAGDFDGRSVAQVLRGIDAEAFADLPEDFARAPERSFRGREPRPAPELPQDGFAAGARSVEAEQADLAARDDLGAAEGPFGPVFDGYRDDPEGAIQRLLSERRGEVADAFVHPEFGDVAFVYGRADEGRRSGFGLAHIVGDHDPETLSMLPKVLRDGVWTRLEAAPGRPGQRVQVDYTDSQAWRAVVVLDYKGDAKSWVMTSYRLAGEGNAQRSGSIYVPTRDAPPDFPGATGPSRNSTAAPTDQDPAGDALRAELAAFRAEDGDILLPGPDGLLRPAQDLLTSIDDDMQLTAVLDACGIGRGSA